jgi:hypothetical protein
LYNKKLKSVLMKSCKFGNVSNISDIGSAVASEFGNVSILEMTRTDY